MAETGEGLHDREAETALLEIAELATSNISLPMGLRAAAQSTTSRRMASAFRAIAAGLEQGQPLTSMLRQLQIPSYLQGILAVAERTGRSPHLLFSLLDQQEQDRIMRRAVWSAVIYPLLVLLIACLLFLLVMLGIVPTIKVLLLDFQLRLTVATHIVLWWSDVGSWILMALLILLAGGMVVARLALGAATWRRLLATLPLVGVLWRWSGTAQFARTLAVLTEGNVPLPDAVRLAGDSVRDLDVQASCEQMAMAIESGQSLAGAMQAAAVLPRPLTPYVRWGEIHGNLPDAMRAASEMFEGRVRLRSEAVRQILPPLIFVMVLVLACVMASVILVPMVSLLRVL
jgi:type II secretory pathway component PulF